MNKFNFDAYVGRWVTVLFHTDNLSVEVTGKLCEICDDFISLEDYEGKIDIGRKDQIFSMTIGFVEKS